MWHPAQPDDLQTRLPVPSRDKKNSTLFNRTLIELTNEA